MADWNNRSKSVSDFVNKALPGKWRWSDPNVLWSDSQATWGGLGLVNWVNRTFVTKGFLLNEDGSFLLLESGGKIVISGDSWANRAKH